jgi:hypothetical protein
MHKSRSFLLAAGCTAAGALGAGAVGAIATDNDRHRKSFGHHGFHGVLGAVHAEAVVPKRDGDFATVVYDRGKVTSVDGRELTVAVGTRDDVYKTETFSVPEGAKLLVWGERDAELSDIEAGDKVAIMRSPKKYVVMAWSKRDHDDDSGDRHKG